MNPLIQEIAIKSLYVIGIMISITFIMKIVIAKYKAATVVTSLFVIGVYVVASSLFYHATQETEVTVILLLLFASMEFGCTLTNLIKGVKI